MMVVITTEFSNSGGSATGTVVIPAPGRIVGIQMALACFPTAAAGNGICTQYLEYAPSSSTSAGAQGRLGTLKMYPQGGAALSSTTGGIAIFIPLNFTVATNKALLHTIIATNCTAEGSIGIYLEIS